MRKLLLTLVPFWSLTAPGQSWQWSQQLGGSGNEYVSLAGTDQSSDVYAFGWFAGSDTQQQYDSCFFDGDTLAGRWDSFLAKYNLDGTLAWARAFDCPSGGVFILSAKVDTLQQRIYVVGAYTEFLSMDTVQLTTPYAGAFISIWNYDGHCLKARNLATNPPNPLDATCTADAVAVDGSGRILVGGRTFPNIATLVGGEAFPGGAYMVQLDQSLEVEWVTVLSEYHDFNAALAPKDVVIIGDRAFVHTDVYLGAEDDTLHVGNFELTGQSGRGFGLVEISVSDGTMEPLYFGGFPYTIFPFAQRMTMASDGTMLLVGNYEGAVSLWSTTIEAPVGQRHAFVARFDTAAVLSELRTFEASTEVSLQGIHAVGLDSYLLVGRLTGTGSWDGFSFNTGSSYDFFTSQHMSNGDCSGLMTFQGASGTGVVPSASGVFVSAVFGSPIAPNPTINIGSETHITNGLGDGIVAKLDQVVSVPQPYMLHEDDLEIYANPNRGSFRLRLPTAFNTERELQLRIYDGTGRLVKEHLLVLDEERPRMDVWDVGPGFYMITVSNGKRTYSGNMVVE